MECMHFQLNINNVDYAARILNPQADAGGFIMKLKVHAPDGMNQAIQNRLQAIAGAANQAIRNLGLEGFNHAGDHFHCFEILGNEDFLMNFRIALGVIGLDVAPALVLPAFLQANLANQNFQVNQQEPDVDMEEI